MKQDIAQCVEQSGKTVELYGWVESVRDHGKVAFIDLRDRSGVVQCVIVGKENLAACKEQVHTQALMRVYGTVQERPEKLRNEAIVTGGVEILVDSFDVVSACAELPYEIDKDTRGVSEAHRLKYRYLDLRSDRMRENIKMRHRANLFFRNYLSDRGVWEIETPYLTKGTPEGAREYIIPSRLHEGEFYVLPQSPQQFKQLLMVGGMEKYFQIVRCFRDEDQRGDRQPEFTQLDMEFSFITQEEIRAFVEEMVHALVKEQYPHSSLTFSPFTVLTYKEAMERYNSDKPDLRKNPQDPTELAFAWIVDFPLFERSKDGSLSSAHHPFTHPHPDDVSRLQSDPLSVRSQAYDLVLNGFEVAGGSIRIHTHDLQQSVFDVLSISREEQEQKFGHLLRAFEFSPPPHGGIAFGLDRLYACLQGEEVIREVMAFPKTAEARDLLMGAPSDISRQALRDAHIELRKKPYQKK